MRNNLTFCETARQGRKTRGISRLLHACKSLISLREFSPPGVRLETGDFSPRQSNHLQRSLLDPSPTPWGTQPHGEKTMLSKTGRIETVDDHTNWWDVDWSRSIKAQEFHGAS